jgi:hypothetical protein
MNQLAPFQGLPIAKDATAPTTYPVGSTIFSTLANVWLYWTGTIWAILISGLVAGGDATDYMYHTGRVNF